MNQILALATKAFKTLLMTLRIVREIKNIDKMYI